MMRIRLRFASVLMVAFVVPVSAQKTARVTVGPNVRVSPPGRSYVEPYIAVSPRNGRNVVVSAQAVDAKLPVFPVAFTSQDGGASWRASQLPEVTELATSGRLRRGVDTSLAFSPEGQLYLSALLMMKPGEPAGEDPVYVFRSDDNGANWRIASVLKSNTFDIPIINAGTHGDFWLVVEVDKSESFAPHNTGASSFVGVYHSEDETAHFVPVAFLGPGDLFFTPARALVLTDGSILVGMSELARFHDYKKITPLNQSRVLAARSIDDGKTFRVPHLVGDYGTWDVEATTQFAVDLSPSSHFRGRVYAAWNRFESGKYDVSLGVSRDNGETWSDRIVLSHPNTNSVFSSVAVSPDGTVGVLWLGAVESKPGCWRTWFAASIDGGESFTPPQEVSDSVSCLDTVETRWIVQIGYLGKPQSVLSTWPHAGDYIGLAADTSGAFHAAWIDARNSDFGIYTTTISIH